MIRASVFSNLTTQFIFVCFLFLTTAEVLNLIRGTVFIKFQESLKKERRRIAITFCCCLFLDTAATGNCNCGALSASSLRHCIASIGYWDCGAQLSTFYCGAQLSTSF